MVRPPGNAASGRLGMVAIGDTMLDEHASPIDLVQVSVLAEEASFDPVVISDPFHPGGRRRGTAPRPGRPPPPKRRSGRR